MELEISYKHAISEAEKNPELLLLALPLLEMLLQTASRGLPLAQYTVSALQDNSNNSTLESPPAAQVPFLFLYKTLLPDIPAYLLQWRSDIPADADILIQAPRNDRSPHSYKDKPPDPAF